MSADVSLSRRSLVMGAALGAASVAAASVSAHAQEGASSASPSASGDGAAPTFADTIAWDGLYDVVIVGFGGAGAVAAKVAAEAGASVLVVDKAPWNEVGGNTRYCGQYFMQSDDFDTTYAYYMAMAGNFRQDEDALATFVQGLCDMPATFKEMYGIDAYITDAETIEFPDLNDGASAMHWMTVREGAGFDASLWKVLRSAVVNDLKDKVDVWYESPAVELIQDPATRTVVGVCVNKEGEPVNVRATNGVVMALGGFENNEAMRECYLGADNMIALGSLHNTGDGIPMVAACGAEIRNTFNYSGYGNLGGLCLPQQEGYHAHILDDNNLGVGSAFVAGGKGERYVNENAQKSGHAIREDCHGRLAYCGEWRVPVHPYANHYVFDQAQYDDLEAAGSLTDAMREHLVSGATVEELCAQCEWLEPEVLTETIRKFNTCVEMGEDLQCKRPIDTMRAFDTAGTIYAIPMKVLMMNTQGGPRRNGSYEVVDADYQPIPHLYAVGEFGGVVANLYNGNGNVAEDLISGRIAGANAAAPKDPLPALENAVAVESTIRYGIDLDYPRFELPVYEAAGDNELIGQTEVGIGDRMVVKVTMDGDKIADITFLEINETVGICDPAVAQIPQAIIDAQSTEVDTVAGCTNTSKGIIDAVANALSQRA